MRRYNLYMRKVTIILIKLQSLVMHKINLAPENSSCVVPSKLLFILTVCYINKCNKEHKLTKETISFDSFGLTYAHT